jgi:uncharacterized protein YggU (UPF0235/DUF167 family)
VDRVDGVRDGVLLARVAARPVDGAANEALRRLLAAALEIAPSRVRLASGGTSRTKRMELHGVTAELVRSRWPGVEV